MFGCEIADTPVDQAGLNRRTAGRIERNGNGRRFLVGERLFRTAAVDASESIGRNADPPDMMAPCSRTTGISMETGRKRRGTRRVNKPGKANSC